MKMRHVAGLCAPAWFNDLSRQGLSENEMKARLTKYIVKHAARQGFDDELWSAEFICALSKLIYGMYSRPMPIGEEKI